MEAFQVILKSFELFGVLICLYACKRKENILKEETLMRKMFQKFIHSFTKWRFQKAVLTSTASELKELRKSISSQMRLIDERIKQLEGGNV